LRAPSASRSGKFAAIDEDEDGRTVVRGAPKIVKRAGASSSKMGMPTSPTTISPAAVIKATLESARGAQSKRSDHLMAGPPSDLLEDMADRRHPADVGAEHTAILQAPSSSGSNTPPPMVQGVKSLSTQMLQPQAIPHGTLPPGSARPLTNPPPPNSHPSNQSGGYAAHSSQSGGYAAQSSQSGGYQAHQSGGYAAQYPGPVPAGSVSGSIVSMTGPQPSMPAHFMVPQAPYSDGRMDPPGTAVTARTKVGGRPAVSWAIALAAFGLFVGVGAVAVMHGNDGFTETSASFVDPSRAAGPGKGAAAQLAAPITPVALVTPVAVTAEAPVGVPPVAVPAAVPAVAAATGAAEVAAPVVTTPPAPVAPPPAGGVAAVPVVAAAPAAPVAPAVTVAVAPRPATQRPAFVPQRPATRPVPPPEEVAAKPAKPVKPAGAKPGGDSAVDEEQRKALKALQESQLETPF